MLFRLTAKNVLQRPLRYLLTSFAIVFSVAAVSAVFIFTGGLRTTFNELATNIESGYDISVQPNVQFGDGGFLIPTVPLETAELLEGVDGVGELSPRVVGFGVIAVDGDGELIIAAGGPNLGVAWGDDPGSASRYFVQSGRRPSAPDEFALDIDSFAEGNFELGEEYLLQIPNTSTEGQTFELTGTFTFGAPDRNALVGARIIALDTDTAVELINGREGFSDITLLVDEGEEIVDVLARIEPLLDDTLIALTQEEVIERTQGDFGQILTIFQTVLLVFAIIIAFVSAFLIFNVFSITLGQRIRELGLLRAVGALGSQVTQLMIGEALLLGVFSTIVGFPAGLGLAWLLRVALSALGFPDNTGLPITALAIGSAIFVGVVVTLLAAIVPAVQARRVPPIAALRDGALLSIERASRPGLAIAPLIGAAVFAGFGLVSNGWQPRFFFPMLAAFLLWFGLSRIDRTLAKFGVFTLGVVLLIAAFFIEAELGETFALIGAGTCVTIAGAILLMPFVAIPLTSILGRIPTAVLVGLIGIGLALGAAASVGGAIWIVITGTPDAVIDATGMDVSPVALAIPLLIVGVVLAVLSFGIVRTAIAARGLSGQLARSNAARNPQRTATTAAALMIGLTLVTAVTVIGDSIKASVSAALSSSITADWLIQAGQGGGPQAIPFSTEVAERLGALDEVESVLQFRIAFPAAWATSESGELTAADLQEFLPVILQLINDDADLSPEELLALQAEIGGTGIEINDAAAVDFATLEDHIDPDFIEIDRSLVGPNAVYFERGVAEEAGLEVGDTFSALFIDLQSEDLVVAGIYDNGFVLGNRVVDLDLWNRHFPSDSDQFLTAITASGVPQEDARAAMEAALEADFPIVEVSTRSEFAEASERQINQTLATVNVLLGLSGVVAALGILVALALSVFERTREIGLFRAVGATRQQTRWIIRWEGVIVAAFGGLTGVIIGVPIGALATSQMPEFLVNQISVPIGTLVGYLLFASIIGLFAAVFPAWTAGRLNVLEAISAD